MKTLFNPHTSILISGILFFCLFCPRFSYGQTDESGKHPADSLVNAESGPETIYELNDIKTEVDSVALIDSYRQAIRERHSLQDTRAGEDITGYADMGTRAISYGGSLYIDDCCAPSEPVHFTITEPNTEIIIQMDFEQNQETGYFLVEITGGTYQQIPSYNLWNCRTTDYYLYKYNCTRTIALNPGNYTISLTHSAYDGNMGSYYFYGYLSFRIYTPSVGETMNDPVIAGNFSNNFEYSDTKNTNDYLNSYSGYASNDIFYKFSLSRRMEVTIHHCGSTITDSYLHLLDSNGARIAYNNDYSGTGACSNNKHAWLKTELDAGTYYVVSEGYGTYNGVIQTHISGMIPPGDTMEDPIVVGSFGESFRYSDTQNTAYFNHVYTGRPTNDVFYKFILTKKMTVVMTHCGSSVDTYMSLLDSNGAIIDYNDDYDGDGRCTTSLHSFIKREMNAGTYYIVSEGFNLNNNIVTNIYGYASEFDYPNIPDEYSTDPESVGAVAGSFGVSATGGATYTIPIEVPEGIGGMKPSVALTYNSQAGNGVAGWGCNLTGTSVITRGTKNLYFDESAKGITFRSDDAYYLDGQRLIHDSGTAGTEGAVYYLETDPFTQITVHGAYTGTTTCNTWFEMTKNGVTYYYGNTTQARQITVNDKVNAWYLDYVEDQYGNYMNYTYTSMQYYRYLASITYGKNTASSTLPEHKIVFSYQSRPDPIPFRLDGYGGSVYYRLYRIAGYTGNTLYREYTLSYANTDHFSRLVSVTEKNGANESLKPTTFIWNYLPSFYQYGRTTTVTAASVYPAVPHADQSFTSADLNGDGISDLVGVFPIRIGTSNRTYAYIYWGSVDTYGNPQFLTGEAFDVGTSFKFDDWVEKKEGCSPIDFDGDGIYELLMPHFSNVNGSASVSFNFISGAFNNISVNYSLVNTNEMVLYSTGDFDNDGKGDIISIEKGHSSNLYRCIISAHKQGTGLQAELKYGIFNLSLPSKPEKLFVFDFNGDGLNDVMVFYSGGYTIFWNSGGIVGNTSMITNVNKYSGTNIGNVYKIVPGDFNGDGMTDFLMNATQSNQWHFAINNGDGTFTKQLACTLEIYEHDFTERDNDKFACHVFDFDHDGKTDVVITKAMYDKEDDIWSDPWGEFRKTHAYWMRSTGSSLAQVAAATSNNNYDGLAGLYVTGDFDGDGRVELMNYGYNCYDGSGTASRNWNFYKNTFLTVNSGNMIKITEGFGNSTDLAYASLISGGIYTKASDSVYPVVNIMLPVSSIKKIIYSNGIAGSIIENYEYGGAKAHLTGKGFLGMMSRKVTNTTLGTVMEEKTTRLHPDRFFPLQTYSETKIETALGTETARTTIDYTVYDRRLKNVFIYPNTITAKDMDENTQTTTFDYNETEGYLNESNTVYGENMYRKTGYSSYEKVGGVYKPELVTVTQRHPDDDTTFVNKTHYQYDASKGYPTRVIENYETGLPLTKVFAYDGFGNLTSSTVSGSGITTVTHHREYDDSKRFVKKEYTAPASTVISYGHDTWGNVTSVKDETESSNILETNYFYDGWGALKQAFTPDGGKTVYSRGWNTGNEQKSYFTLVQGKKQPWVKTWYDRAGKETITETVGPGNLSIVSTHSYNSKGQLASVTTQQGDLTTSETYGYDERGRTTGYTGATGQRITYDYDNRSVTTTTNGRAYTKTYDAWGGLASSSDPVSSIRYEYRSTGKPYEVVAANATFSMTYDDCGNQQTLTDPNAGTTTFTYDALGRVKTRTDGRGITLTNEYDGLNRIKYTTTGTFRTDYRYGSSGYNKHRLVSMKTATDSVNYDYDRFGRLLTERRYVNGEETITFGYGYDADGMPASVAYPGNVRLTYSYDTYGNLVKVFDGLQSVWELTGVNGMQTTSRQGGHTATASFDSRGLLTGLRTVRGSTVVRDMGFTFDGNKGNLDVRTGMMGQREAFYYDDLDRLTTVNHGDPETEVMSIDYDDNGNILSKTDLDEYTYHATKKHAVEYVDNTAGLISKSQKITWNAFGKAENLKDTVAGDTYELDIFYGPDQQRWKTVLKKNDTPAKTTIYAGDYEKIIDHETGIPRHVYYIHGGDGLAAVYMQSNQSGRTWYAHTDHLGSILKLTDNSDNVAFEASYDAWGQPDVTINTIGFHRGYTGHEHLPEFGLINMNGRMYDPLVGRFLSPDPYVQDPEYSQSFNRYSYCWNNPLIYTDPSGELIGEILFIAAMTYIGGMQTNFMYAAENGGNPFNPGNWNWKNPMTYISMAASAYSAYTQIGGWNGFSTSDVTNNFGNSSRWLDYETPEKYKLIAGPPEGGNAFPNYNLLKEVVVTPQNIQSTTARVVPVALTLMSADGPLPIGDLIAASVFGVAALYDLSQITYVTYTLKNPSTNQIYVGRTSGYGHPHDVMMKRYYSHEYRQLGYGSPELDRVAQGYPVGYSAIRGREQDLIDAYGGIGTLKLGNRINGISPLNPNGRLIYRPTSKLFFGNIDPLLLRR